MLKFINKKGEKVMEVKDSGETIILNEQLQKSFDAHDSTKSTQEEKSENE